MIECRKLKNLDEKNILKKLIELLEQQEKIKIAYTVLEKG